MEGCIVTDLKVHSQRNCYRLSPEQMQAIQNQRFSVHLEPDTNMAELREGFFSYAAGPTTEPVLLLWIYGGKVIHKKTNVEALFSLFQL